MKHYFLGMAQEYCGGEWFNHLISVGRKKDLSALRNFLTKKYQGKAMLCKNGRSALALALKAYFEPGDAVIVNGFTCYAVYEAVKAAGLTPVFADISKEDLNFDADTIEKAMNDKVKGIIVQNTLGNPVDIEEIEEFAKEHGLMIVEDLAHSAGVRYFDDREAGTVGVATALSFGKEKSIDTVSGGAVIFREAPLHEIKAPSKAPKPSDYLRAKFYPMFGALCRSLTYIGVGGALMRCLVKIHWVERSADNKLDLKRRCNKFEAKLALKQLTRLRKNGEGPIRDFYFVHDRAELLKKLQAKGYYFGGFWYEKPVSPERYYKKVHFDEMNCQNACYVAEHIINLPVYYSRRDLTPALKIIKKYLENDK
ncbi:DegT/DnrJ/EryC1/StrS aminotransferase family protein [Candidatus Saccharibacteria bacterium]|nr:DegT/DnrJ/EryC1/StrS aminotransferase family protein [Candidatus Saccharibacteria bacterium]